jgi:hypothetical protein
MVGLKEAEALWGIAQPVTTQPMLPGGAGTAGVGIGRKLRTARR